MIPFHEFASIVPMLEGAERDEFNEDVRRNRLRQKIDILDDQILDGRNRYVAALAAGLLEPDNAWQDRPSLFRRFLPEIDGDPLAYVISQNISRRHLNESQRAMAAARIAKMPAHRPAAAGDDKSANLPTYSQPQAAAQLNVSPRLVRSARAVQQNAEPELSLAVDQGRITVTAAASAAKLAPETQRRIAELAATDKPNVVRTVLKQETRAARERNPDLQAPEGKFGVIVEDFEWDYEVRSRETGMDRHAANHYETADDAHTPEEIVARTAARFACAADNCVLWQWVPAPHLAIGLKVMELRGFKYVSNYVWRKPTIITGWWARFKHEHLLIGVKGSVPCPAPGTQWDSDIEAALGKHSAKPELFLEMIEQYFPTWRKIELNRRGPARPGWSAWGNEAEPAVIDPILAQHKARREFPVGHTVAMTNPVIDDVQMEITTCQCGMNWSCRWDDPGRHDILDAAIERHWQKFDHFRVKIDGRGRPIVPGYGCANGDGCGCQVVDGANSFEEAIAKRGRCRNWRPDAKGAGDRDEEQPAPSSNEPEKLIPLPPHNPETGELIEGWECSRGEGCACEADARGECPFWRETQGEDYAGPPSADTEAAA